MPAHCFSFGSEGRGAPSARLRSPAYLVLFLEPCQSLRSLYAVLRHSAVCPRMGIRIALQNSRVRLADETFRERSRAGCAAPVGFETHVALDAGSHRFRHKPRYFPRSQTHARWSCKRIPGRRLPGRAQLGVPIVPVSLVGSFQHHRTGHWMLWPGKITVYLHDTIETKGLHKEEVPALRDRVRAIIAGPVEAPLRAQERELL